MRDLNPREWQRLRNGECALCRGTDFQPGPRGGAAQNFECIACTVRYNLTYWQGDLVFAQAIGMRPKPDDWAMYRREFPVGLLPAFVDGTRSPP